MNNIAYKHYRVKGIFLLTIAVLLMVAGARGAFMLSGVVFDRSYMMTQRVLGEPGATSWLWAKFILNVVMALAGLVVLLLTVQRRSKISKA